MRLWKNILAWVAERIDNSISIYRTVLCIANWRKQTLKNNPKKNISPHGLSMVALDPLLANHDNSHF